MCRLELFYSVYPCEFVILGCLKKAEISNNCTGTGTTVQVEIEHLGLFSIFCTAITIMCG